MDPPLLIVFSGLPGTGKSTVAAAIGQTRGIPVFSVDPIEAAILRAGIARGFASGLAAYLVVETLADAELTAGRDAIVDAVNAVEPAKDMWRALARRHDARLSVIACTSSDESVHRARVVGRDRGLAGLPEPTWEDVERRRRETTDWVEPTLVLDAVDPIEANVARALAWLDSP